MTAPTTAPPVEVPHRRDKPREEAPPVVAPPPGHPRFPYYDSLRGLAALMVLVIHCMGSAEAMGAPLSDVVNHFEVSIAILFMLSAFLLYRPFVATRLGKGPDVALRDYALRRVLRIVPGYYMAMLALGIFPGLLGVYGKDWWAYFGFAQIYHPLYDPAAACSEAPYCGIAPAWTLAVEVSFYALLPLFVILMGWLSQRLRRSIRFELALFATLGAASALARYWAFEHLDTAAWLLQTLPTVFLWLAAGMALAVISATLQGRERESRFAMLVTNRPWAPWLAAFALYGMLMIVLEPVPYFYGQTPAMATFKFVVFAAITFLLLLPATFGDHAGGWPRRILANRFLAWLGVIAYGVYLYHLPLMYEFLELGIKDIEGSFLRWMTLTAATLTAAIACGAASYYLLERRFLKLKYRPREQIRALARCLGRDVAPER